MIAKSRLSNIDTDTTIVYTVHNNYLIFRASIESLFDNVDMSSFDKIIIVDDCSNEQMMISFLDYLAKFDFIQIIKTGPPCDYSFHNNRQVAGLPSDSIDGKTSSFGHGISQNIGIKNTSTEFVLFVDSDILFMPMAKNLVSEMKTCMLLDDKIMSTGQLVGEVSGIKIFDKPFKLDNQRGQLIETRGGWPVHILAMSRTSGWTKENLSYMCNGGWTNEQYVPSLWLHGFKTCNFDVFVDKYAIHLGYATLRQTRSNSDVQKIVYCKDGGKYSRTRGSWYGHHFVPYTTDEFLLLLKESYSDRDFSDRYNVVTW